MDGDTVITMFYGAAISTLVGLLGTVVVNVANRSSHRRDARDDASAARKAGELDELRGRLRDVVAEMVAFVRLRDAETGFCALAISKRAELRRLQAALEPLLDGGGRGDLERLLSALCGDEARAEREAAEQAGRELLEWLAGL